MPHTATRFTLWNPLAFDILSSATVQVKASWANALSAAYFALKNVKSDWIESSSKGERKVRVQGFIIHLERATSRMKQVQRLCEMLPTTSTEIVSAVDGQKLTAKQKACYRLHHLRPSYPFKLLPGEVATFLSHRSCWQAVVDGDMDAALVVEDDIELSKPDFIAAFKLVSEHIEQGDLVRFPIKIREKKKHFLSGAAYPNLMTTRSIGLGMVAYIVTRDAARKLLEKTEKFDRPVDTYLQLNWHHEVRILTVWPSGVSEISRDLGGSLIHARKGFKNKIRKELLRPIYRTKLFAYRIFTKA